MPQKIKPNIPEHLEQEVKSEAVKDIATKVAGILSAILPIVAILGLNLDWFTAEFINNVYIAILSIGTLIVNVWTIWKNHFTTKKRQEQNAVLKQTGMKE